MKTTFIYALCEPGTRTVRYIGKTNDVARRLKEHLKPKQKKTYLGNLLRSLRVLGTFPEMIIFREVEGDGSDAEIRYIQRARGFGMRLTNSTDGGEGVTMTPEIRAKIGASHLGVPEPPKSLETLAKMSAAARGDKNPFFGRTHTPKTKALQSALKTGTNHPLFGKPRPPEVRAKISAGNLGKIVTPETCARISASKIGALKGVPWSPARRAAQDAKKVLKEAAK